MAKDNELFKETRPAATIRFDSYGPECLLSERGLAVLLGVDVTQVLEAVERKELPRPFALLGEQFWIMGAIVDFFESRGTGKGE